MSTTGLKQTHLHCCNSTFDWLKQPKSFYCELWEVTYRHKSTVVTIPKGNTVEKLHQCDYCQKRFTNRENLQRHHLTNTGEKLHQCEYCQKRFTRSSIYFTRPHLDPHWGETTPVWLLSEEIHPQQYSTGSYHHPHCGETTPVWLLSEEIHNVMI